MFQALTLSELQSNLKVVEANLEARKTAAEAEISSYETILKTYVSLAETKLATDMTEASQPYSTTINEYIVQAAQEGKLLVECSIQVIWTLFFTGKSIAKCVSVSEDNFSKLASAALAEVEAKIKAISDNAETKLSAVTTAIDSASTKIKALAEEIDQCSSDDCAPELNSDLVQLYELAVNDIDSALFKALEYILNFAPTSLDGYVLDQAAFETSYASLLDYVQACL